jgi:hypothetical protein
VWLPEWDGLCAAPAAEAVLAALGADVDLADPRASPPVPLPWRRTPSIQDTGAPCSTPISRGVINDPVLPSGLFQKGKARQGLTRLRQFAKL